MAKYRVTTNQQGGVSFLTVIFLSLILVIVTMSFVRITINEQREAIDDDLVTRAFYAAESGVEDGKRAIVDYLNGGPAPDDGTCSPAPGQSGELDVGNLEAEYTCQLIEMTPGEFKTTLGAWESIVIPLRGTGGFDRVNVEWHEPSNDGVGYGLRGDNQLINGPEWMTGNYPALVKASIFRVSDSPPGTLGYVNTLQGTLRSGYLIPRSSGTPTISASSGFNKAKIATPCQSGQTGSNPVCSKIITDLPQASGYTVYLVLQAMYKGTRVTATLLDSSDAVVPIRDTQAVIDVTGRAGDVYRRVEARVSLDPEVFPLPDLVIWSNVELCKDFTITGNTGDFDPGECDWSN